MSGDAAVGPRWHDEALAVAATAGTWTGAVLAPPVLGAAGALVTGTAVLALGLWRWSRSALAGASAPMPVVVLVLTGTALIGGHRGAGADAAYRPLDPGPFAGSATVIGDPEPIGVAGWRAELRLADGSRIDATAHGQPGRELQRSAVGAAVVVEGRLRPIGDRPWLRARHIVARASLDAVRPTRDAPPPVRAVEAVRTRIAAGADTLSDDARPLYLGLVLGDDRFQSAGQTLRFRLSGLTHLLAVSGQNVAFVLAALDPVTRRLSPRGRLGAMVGALVVFALITRLEPSVLRAVVTAALSTWAVVEGRSRSGLGVLAAAVTVLIWADPFLVHAVGFQLSVAASTGILLLGPVAAGRLGGPRWLAQPLATSLSAQLGVAPVLHHHFGPLPLVAIPANLLAGWAAGSIMTWGLTVGVVAGLLPEGLAGVVQRPVGLLVWWLDLVASLGARLPGPRTGPALLAALLTGLAVIRVAPIGARRTVAAALVAGVAAVATPRPPDSAVDCSDGMAWRPAAGRVPSTLIVGEGAGVGAVEDCRLLGIRRVDVVVVTAGDRRAAETIATLREVSAVGRVLAPPRHRIVGAIAVRRPLRLVGSPHDLTVEPDLGGTSLVVEEVAPP